MGLVEKRIIAAYQKEQFPAWQERLKQLVGAELEYDVAWNEIVKEGFPDAYPATLDYNFFQPLFNALSSICSDDIGTESFRETIRRIKIGNLREWSSLEAKVDGDCLSLDSDPTYERTDGSVQDYSGRIQKVLEAAL